MNNITFILIIVVILILAMLVVPRWRLKRALPQVIRIFKEHSAIGIKNAKTVSELGLSSQSALGRLWGGRDYKQYALTALMKAEIIQMTEDGRLYIVEDKLIASGLEKGAPYYR